MFFEVELEDGSLRRFDCNPSIPGGVVLHFADITTGGDDGMQRGASAISAVKDLFKAAIVRRQQDQFWAMVNGDDPQGVIDISILMEVAFYLAEAYTERPTGASSANGSSGTTSGSDSTAGARPEVLTYSRPPQTVPST